MCFILDAILNSYGLKLPLSGNKKKKTSEYEQEMPLSQTTDQPTAPRGIDTEH